METQSNNKKTFSKRLSQKGKIILLSFALLFCTIGAVFIYQSVNNKGDAVQSMLEGDRSLDKYKELKVENSDFYAWLLIEDTTIDFPVMYRDNEYYLTHNFKHEDDPYGVPFIDDRCNITERSTNLLIHGHSTLAGPIDRMFDQLQKYRDQKFYEAHKYIHLDTPEEKEIYEIVMVIESRIMYQDEDDYRYYNFIDSKNQDEYEHNIEQLKNIELYDTGVTTTYGDELITLSTCDYSRENGRLAVIAKKVMQ